ncbi:MAG: NHLP family bacteriocin export ABC transporter peptidase/permease/ATPase subunit [Candidatus Paraimprobicoccus trichonymphae]|uniref:NHLP family bacteriocin export ABC transporter peptidase/permease/ATPase subunit n=1 Tax=Candidatus Paraimprobicoccus trichonymphae TaxID=3033793 RepID=A0AA48L1P3_9FIRM|nr:MAG: NHLP family bacteriocin export ABC transporter peptidase/permease/ATPase subunit [Candidatus Paraimprobicoccus trichonymphae]
MKKAIKVPVIMQMEALECGAACLCMIAAYYKKWIPLTKVRDDCGVSRDGSVAKNIVEAGRNYDFESAGYRLEPSDLKSIQWPVILHWDFNHFVVFCGFDNKMQKVYINDPGRGRVTVSIQEFDKSFTGIVLSFVPSKNFKPEGKPKSVVAFAKKSLKGATFPFLIAIVISIILEIISMATPIFDKVFYDDILSGKRSDWLMSFLGIMLIILLIQTLVGIIKSIYWTKIEGKFAVTSSAEFMWHVLRLPLDFFSQRYIGDIASRQESTAQVALTAIQKIAPVFIDSISLVFYLFIMINYSWQLTIIGISAIIIDIFITKYTSEKVLNFQRASVPNAGKLASITYSGIENVETIKSTGAESGYFERWAGYYARQSNASVALAKFNAYFGTLPRLVNDLSDTVMMVAGTYLIMHGNITLGIFTAFGRFLKLFLNPVSTFMDIYQSFISMRCDMERIDDVLEYPTDVKNVTASKDDKTDRKLLGKLEIKNLTFGYSKLAKPLLEDFSLNLDPGSWVALVGGSGSGKSTIAKLIMNLYKPWKGEILFDGLKRSKIDDYRFHASIAMVDQERIIFDDTIKNNIKIWDESIEDFAITIAARDAGIHDDILSRKDGYNHKMREGGKDFSGGQCQRMEIARALSQEPTLIVLDEATSALDSKTEQKIMQNIKDLRCSCLVVAHRLSTIRDCNEIIVLNGGKVVQRGTHDELMKAENNHYNKLITTE